MVHQAKVLPTISRQHRPNCLCSLVSWYLRKYWWQTRTLSGVPAGRPCARLRTSGPGIAPPLKPLSTSTTVAAFSASSTGVVGVNSTPSICILGGGFGGLYTAIRLESLMWPKDQKPKITLVDQNDRFVFKPLLYDLLTKTASEDEVAPEYSALLAPYNVRSCHLQRITSRCVTHSWVQCESGSTSPVRLPGVTNTAANPRCSDMHWPLPRACYVDIGNLTDSSEDVREHCTALPLGCCVISFTDPEVTSQQQHVSVWPAKARHQYRQLLHVPSVSVPVVEWHSGTFGLVMRSGPCRRAPQV